MNGPKLPSPPSPTITAQPASPAVGCDGKPRVRRHWSVKEKAEHLALFAESGLSQVEYCEEMGISPATFSLWRRQSRVESPAEAARNQTFAEVIVTEPIAGASSVAPVVVHLSSGTRIEVAVGTDPLWLASLLKTLTCP